MYALADYLCTPGTLLSEFHAQLFYRPPLLTSEPLGLLHSLPAAHTSNGLERAGISGAIALSTPPPSCARLTSYQPLLHIMSPVSTPPAKPAMVDLCLTPSPTLQSNTNPLTPRVFYGTLIHSLSLTQTEYLTSALLGVSSAGTIAFIERDVKPEEVEAKLEQRGWKKAQLVKLKHGEFLIPG